MDDQIDRFLNLVEVLGGGLVLAGGIGAIFESILWPVSVACIGGGLLAIVDGLRRILHPRRKQ